MAHDKGKCNLFSGLIIRRARERHERRERPAEATLRGKTLIRTLLEEQPASLPHLHQLALLGPLANIFDIRQNTCHPVANRCALLPQHITNTNFLPDLVEAVLHVLEIERQPGLNVGQTHAAIFVFPTVIFLDNLLRIVLEVAIMRLTTEDAVYLAQATDATLNETGVDKSAGIKP